MRILASAFYVHIGTYINTGYVDCNDVTICCPLRIEPTCVSNHLVVQASIVPVSWIHNIEFLINWRVFLRKATIILIIYHCLCYLHCLPVTQQVYITLFTCRPPLHIFRHTFQSSSEVLSPKSPNKRNLKKRYPRVSLHLALLFVFTGTSANPERKI